MCEQVKKNCEQIKTLKIQSKKKIKMYKALIRK